MGRVTGVIGELIARSNRLGADPATTNYAGGNTSAKGTATDPVTGQAIVSFVILRGTAEEGADIASELRNHVAKALGPIAKPRQILVVPELPKTRSGKIMRRLLRDVAENRSVGDVTTLADSTVMDLISEKLPSAKSED